LARSRSRSSPTSCPSRRADGPTGARAAARAGYTADGYRIADLSDEPVPFAYGGVLGDHVAGRPAQGVVGLDLRVHGYENLYVADSSVFPRNIWVSCQATDMAMSHHAATHVAA